MASTLVNISVAILFLSALIGVSETKSVSSQRELIRYLDDPLEDESGTVEIKYQNDDVSLGQPGRKNLINFESRSESKSYQESKNEHQKKPYKKIGTTSTETPPSPTTTETNTLTKASETNMVVNGNASISLSESSNAKFKASITSSFDSFLSTVLNLI